MLAGAAHSAPGLLRRYPGVNDVVVWNEPNAARFWRPQYDADGQSAAPASYEALVAGCWDALHAVRTSANVIAATAARVNDNPALGSASHSPVNFYSKLGEAYRASLDRPTPKPSYRPFKAAVRAVAAGQVDCDRYAKLAADPGAEIGFSGSPPKPAPPKKKGPPIIVVK